MPARPCACPTRHMYRTCPTRHSAGLALCSSPCRTERNAMRDACERRTVNRTTDTFVTSQLTYKRERYTYATHTPARAHTQRHKRGRQITLISETNQKRVAYRSRRRAHGPGWRGRCGAQKGAHIGTSRGRSSMTGVVLSFVWCTPTYPLPHGSRQRPSKPYSVQGRRTNYRSCSRWRKKTRRR